MSQKNKFKFWDVFRKPVPSGPSVIDVPPQERARVEQMIANGKSGPAVDIAKSLHKRWRLPASEALLVDAYVARILSLVARKMDVEANALLALVQERHPSARERLKEAIVPMKARAGDIESLMELLANGSMTPAKRAELETGLRRAIDDPARVARCEALPGDHPIRVAAGAVAGALEAVASGPVAAEALALPEVSRQSPLAPWKMVVRAMGAYYAGDDALCEKYLQTVDSTTPAARVAPVLRVLIGQKQRLTPAAQSLAKQVDGGVAELRVALASLDQAFEKKNYGLALQETARAVGLCKEAAPESLERLKQHISIRSLMAGVKPERVVVAMGGPSLKNAHFWGLLARQHEESRESPLDVPMACSGWEEFRRHAVHEKWFPDRGPEIATLYLHMAELWQRIAKEALDDVAQNFAMKFEGHRGYYAGQPAEIRQLMPAPGRDDYYYLSPYVLLERACQADPCAENFQRWLSVAKEHGGDSEPIATQWAAALPRDIPPVLYLMQSAEKRNALKKAFNLMEQAERIDGLNPEVRKARLRLLVSLAVRHLQQNKTRLAEPELRQIEALPQAQQGDRPALVAALRWLFCTLQAEASRAEAERAEIARQLGSGAAAMLLLNAVAAASKHGKKAPELKAGGGPWTAAAGRVCALCDDAGIEVTIPRVVSKGLLTELGGKNPGGEAAGMVSLGEAAVRGDDMQLAYAVSGAGLKLAQDHWAEFLFLRARAMPDWEEEREVECLSAASELARRQRKADLLRRIGEWREGDMVFLNGGRADVAMSSEEINSLVEREAKKRGFPNPPRRVSRGFEEDMGYCDCPDCRAQRGEIPLGMPPELERMLDQFGPEEVIRMMGEMLAGGLPKRKRRGRRLFENEDFPF